MKLLFGLSTGYTMPEISAEGAALIEAGSGRIIFSKNPDKKLKMASTTKVMTGLLAIEEEYLSTKVKASKEASRVEGSSIYLREEEKLTLEDMLYGLILESGNDSAHAIAEHIAGDIEGFNVLMNNRAREAGAVSTNFQNPHGLPAKDHYTTAKDLAKISREAMKEPVFERVVSTKRKVIPGPKEEIDLRFLRNTNKFLNRYPGADGIKTGWTKKAGRCLVFSASKDGVQLIGALLNAPTMYEDAEKILDWAFSKYEMKLLLEKDQVIGTLPLKKEMDEEILIAPSDNIELPVSRAEIKDISYIIRPKDNISFPVAKDEKVGVLEVNIEGALVHRCKLKSVNEVKGKGFIARLIDLVGG